MGKFKKILSILVLSFGVLLSSSPVLADHVPSTKVVTVQKGDTLYGIAQKYHTTVKNIMDLNQLEGTIIYPGQDLILMKEEKQYHKVMAGSFLKYDYALNRIAFLEKKDIDAIVVEYVMNGEKYFRVQAGAFINKNNADQQLEKVKEAGISDAYILLSAQDQSN